MSSRRNFALEIIEKVVGDRPTAEMVLERLQDEGFIHLGHGNVEIDQVTEAFQEAFGSTKVTRYDRYAANRLVQKHGAASIIGIIKLYASMQDDRYAPSVGSVQQLEDKWVSVLGYIRKKGQQSEVIQL